MFAEKYSVLNYAPTALNKPDQPWYVTVEGDAIVARWKWMDAYFFAPGEVSEETKQYTFRAVLGNNGKWREVDYTDQKSAGVSMSGGNLKFGASSQKFIGKTTQKSVTFGLGKDKQTGATGIIKFKFDTSLVKEPIRAYLAQYGWKK